MNGDTPITQSKSPVVFQKKGNEIIAKINRSWIIDLPDAQFGVGQVQSSDQKVTIDLSQLSVITFTVCDELGNQRTATVLGYFSDEV